MITVVAGTNRPQSASRLIAVEIVDIYRVRSVAARLLDLADLPPEISSPRSYATKPPAFHRWSETIINSTGLLFVVPEYHGGVAGVLKYFIDMLPMPQSFENKPVGCLGESVGSAARAVKQLLDICGERNGYVFADTVLIPRSRIAVNEGLRDAEDRLRLAQQAEAFAGFVEATRSDRDPHRRVAGYLDACNAIEATD